MNLRIFSKAHAVSFFPHSANLSALFSSVTPCIPAKSRNLSKFPWYLYLVRGDFIASKYNNQEFDKNASFAFCSNLYLSPIISWNPLKSTDIVVGPVGFEPTTASAPGLYPNRDGILDQARR